MALTNMGWPAEHQVALIKLVESGLSGAEVAGELNRVFGTSYSRNAAIGKAVRLKMSLQGKPKGDSTRFPKREAGTVLAVVTAKPYRVPRPVRARELTEAACAAIVPLHIRCVELEPPHCRWPYGEADITFCGHERLPDHPYCLDHWHLSRSEGTRSEREAHRV
jgi:GcrA cell cycle regulator